MSLGIDEDILDLVMSDEIEQKTESILALARECWPVDVGAFLMGLGIGDWVVAGKTDDEIVALVRAALEKLRAFIPQLAPPEGDAPS